MYVFGLSPSIFAFCVLYADLCEDIEVKQQLVEIIETVKNRHKKVDRDGRYGLSDRRRSSARRFTLVCLS